MKRFLIVTLLALFIGTALGAGLAFTLTPDAGVQGAVTGITQAKFPPPAVQRDPIVHPFITFTCVDFETTPAPAGGGMTMSDPNAPAPGAVKTWKSWRRSVRADTITGIEEGLGDYAGYTAVYTSCEFDVNLKVPEGDLFYVRGDKKAIDAIVAQVTGTRVINATFDETR
jgi:hypothetical protein